MVKAGMVLVAITEVVGIIVGVTVAEGTTVCEGSTVAGEGAGVHADRQSASITTASTDLFILLLIRQSLRFQHSKNPLVCQPSFKWRVRIPALLSTPW